MPEQGVRSTYSQCPFQIQMHDDYGLLSTGTAFYFELGSEWFLITNWHNLSGRDFLTKQPLSSNARIPTHITAMLSTYVTTIGQAIPDKQGTFGVIPHRVDIFKDDCPLWFEHPELGSDCDVVALPMPRPVSCPTFMHNAANLISKVKIPVEPGNPVHIIGFPMSMSIGFGLPLWKSGYIASEPYYDIRIDGKIPEQGGHSIGGNQIPAFFIDSQTRPGMSGSPVFASYDGVWDMTDPYRDLNIEEEMKNGTPNVFLAGAPQREFVGCYSGRVGIQEQQAALGLCWRKDVIELICASKHPGK